MGQQQSSKLHAPLTFGYINHNQSQGEENITFEQYLDKSGRDVSTPDFVRDNPHLYKLELTCQHCTKEKQVVVAEQVNKPCFHCNRNKRLSLVRHDLENDLNYIDETYYPNLVHYEEEEEEVEDYRGTSSNEEEEREVEEEEEDTEEDAEGWSKLTIGQVTQAKGLVSSPHSSVDLSGKSLIKLSSSIGYLNNLTKLDLSDNQMISLPNAIGQLKNLRIFNASKNQLESIPETIIGLTKLKAVNLSQNKLKSLPKGIGSLPNLIILILNQNQLKNIPREISNLIELITLNVSNNPLKSIPAEIATLKTLRKLIAENCEFETEFIYPLTHDPPTLFEICARNLSNSKKKLPSLPHHITEYFKKEQTCSFCYGPYFDSFVSRGKFIERTNGQLIALDYKLCCAHWSDENDRISAMFSTPYDKQPQPEIILDGLLTPIQEPQDYFSSIRSHKSNRTLLHQDIPQEPSSSSSSPFRPRSSSSSSLFHTANSTTHSIPLQELAEQENHILPFATLNSRQSQQVNQILLLEQQEESPPTIPRQLRKSNSRVIKEGFAQLSVRLGRKSRDRSETL